MNCEASNTAAAAENLEGSVSALALEEPITRAPESPSKKKKKSKSAMNDSSASLDLNAAPESPKKSKKKSSSKSHSSSSSKSKLVDSSKAKLDASTASLLENSQTSLSAPESPSRKSKKSSKSSSKEKDNKLPHDEEKIITMLTQDFWKENADTVELLTALHSLLQADETKNVQKNRSVSVQLGAPLLVLTQMKDAVDDGAIQSTGLHILRCWGNMEKATAPWYVLCAVGALQRVNEILRAETTDETKDLQDNALHFVEQMVADAAGSKLFLQHDGLTTLQHIVTGRNGTFIPRALDALATLCTTAGTAARKAVTQQIGKSVLLDGTATTQLQSAILSLLSDMGDNEDTAKGLIQGDGVATLAEAFDKLYEERPSIAKKSFDLLQLLANQGGPAARQAIAETTVLDVLVKHMRAEPMDEVIQKRACNFITSLAAMEQKQAVKASGILKDVAKIFTNFSATDQTNDPVLKAAHRAMDASATEE